MLNGIGLGFFIAMTLLFVWSGIRAWRLDKGLLKWLGMGCALPLGVAALLASVLTLDGLIKQHARSAPVPDLRVAVTPERIQRGRAIADGFCGACHTVTGTLTGGRDLGQHLAVDVGSFVSANLTPAGPLRLWSDGQIFRAIRNGVGADGGWLVIMSYTNVGRLSDADIQDVIAYIRSLPAAGRSSAGAPDHLNLLGVIMLGAGMLPTGKPILTGTITAPPKGPTARYGAYILSYQDCRECHGANLGGGAQGQLLPIGPDLSLVKDWKPSEFIATLRSGIDPGGHALSNKMPWRAIGKMDDASLTALYLYLAQMPGS